MKLKLFKILLFCLWIFSSKVNAQILNPVTFPVTNAGGSIECMYYDTLTQTLYLGGNFTSIGGIPRTNLAAIDAATGAVLPWAPTSNGPVYAIDKYTTSVYVGGNFTQLNAQIRNNAGALNSVSGTTATFNPNVGGGMVNSIFVNSSTIYLGGTFSLIGATARNNLAAFTQSTNALKATWDPSIVMTSVSVTSVNKISESNGKVVALCDVGGTSGIELLDASTANELNYFYSNNSIEDFYLKSSTLFAAGNFTSVDTIGSNTFFKTHLFIYNLATRLLIPYPNTPVAFSTSVTEYNDSIYYSVNANSGNCDVFNTTSMNTVGSASLPNLFSNRFKNTVTGNAKLFTLRSTATCLTTSSIQNQIGSYCLNPISPGQFILSDTTACMGTTGVNYAIAPVNYYSAYAWSYSGTGATINGSGSSVTLDFSQTATSGILSVKGVTDCGLQTPLRSISITIEPPVNANAGPDKNFTCDSTQLILTGTSLTSQVNYFWTGPFTNSATQNISITQTGNYILTVTNTLTTCTKTDTVTIAIDTVHPVINSIAGNFVLTCKIDSVLLNGSTANASDSIWWVQGGGGIFSDPHYANNPNSFYFEAKNIGNGCIDSVLIVVTTQTVQPTFTMPSTNGLYFYQTITCDTSSVILNSTGGTSSAILYWDDLSTTGNDSLPNPITINFSGSFTCYAYDTLNGCISSGSILTQTDTTKPTLNTLPDSLFMNCSYSTIVLNADSGFSSGAILSWTGPFSFSSADPATATQQGMYFAKSFKTSNGCFAIDSVFAGLNHTLSISLGNDTLICPGTSVNYSVSVVGGTLPFNYLWSDGTTNSSAAFSPADTAIYSVTVSDQNNCIGKDTAVVFIPPALNDSLKTFKPCDAGTSNGQLQIFAYGGIAPYQFSIDTGITFQTLNLFDSLGYGNYSVIIRDTLGCTKNISAGINLQSSSFQADFLVATNSFADSTLVLVDICNPRPDSVWWEIPPNANLTGTDSTGTQFYVSVADTGTYIIIMHAQFGNCEVTDTSDVHLIPWDSTYANINNGGIDSVTIFPNPAPNGQFNLYLKFFKKQTFAIYIFNSTGMNELWRQSVYENYLYSNLISTGLTSGTYILRIVGEYDSRNLIFVIP